MKCSVNLNWQILVFPKLSERQNAQKKEIKANCNHPQTICIYDPSTDTWRKLMGKRHEWNWTKYFFGCRKTEGCLIVHALSVRHEKKKKNTQKRQSGCAACSLLNSLNHPPLIQPDTANFGIKVWNENQYLFWAWKQSDCTLGRAWARHLFSVICKEDNRNFPVWNI